MEIIDRLERRFGRLAFPGFLRFYTLFHVLVFVLQIIRPGVGGLLEFDRDKVLSGEVWRVATMFFASSGFGGLDPVSILFLLCAVNFMFMVSDGLEGAWGPFKASLFYYLGVACILLLNFFYPVALPLSGAFLYASAFFAFATMFPHVQVRLFLLIPVEVAFLALIQLAGLLIASLLSPVLLPYFLIVFLNYILWVGIPALRRRARLVDAGQRRKGFQGSKGGRDAFHNCVVCGKTDVSDPQLEFRVGRDGEEYCVSHLPGDANG